MKSSKSKPDLVTCVSRSSMRGDVVLDANLVEAFDYVGLNADAHIFRTLHQQGIVDQVSQYILLLRGHFVVELLWSTRRAVLLGLRAKLRLGVIEIALGNDFVVHAGHDLFEGDSLLLRARPGSQR